MVCQKLCQNSVSGWGSLEESNWFFLDGRMIAKWWFRLCWQMPLDFCLFGATSPSCCSCGCVQHGIFVEVAVASRWHGMGMATSWPSMNEYCVNSFHCPTYMRCTRRKRRHQWPGAFSGPRVTKEFQVCPNPFYILLYRLLPVYLAKFRPKRVWGIESSPAVFVCTILDGEPLAAGIILHRRCTRM